MAKRIVVALGGNALGNTPEEQLKLVKNTAKSIVEMTKEGYEVIVGHGNDKLSNGLRRKWRS